jgi:ABC-type dipeptide/oligopeptide/nickel transport system ATPase subunit
MSPSPLLAVENVSKRYSRAGRTHAALHDVSFELQAGRTLAVVGESGAGKSTLARLVAGLESPTEGRVEVNGAAPRPRSGAPGPVQMVFQHPTEALNPLRSVGSSATFRPRPLSGR